MCHLVLTTHQLTHDDRLTMTGAENSRSGTEASEVPRSQRSSEQDDRPSRAKGASTGRGALAAQHENPSVQRSQSSEPLSQGQHHETSVRTYANGSRAYPQVTHAAQVMRPASPTAPAGRARLQGTAPAGRASCTRTPMPCGRRPPCHGRAEARWARRRRPCGHSHSDATRHAP